MMGILQWLLLDFEAMIELQHGKMESLHCNTTCRIEEILWHLTDSCIRRPS